MRTEKEQSEERSREQPPSLGDGGCQFEVAKPDALSSVNKAAAWEK